MTIFDSEKTKNIAKLLRRSDQNFTFDKTGIKDRLFLSLNDPSPHRTSHPPERAWWLNFNITAGIAITLLAASATFLIAQDARPGDRLFALNKLREKVLLALPLPVEKRVEITADIVVQRFEALDQLPAQVAVDPTLAKKKLQTIQESQESYTRAVETITVQQNALEQNNQAEKAEKLDTVLTDLEKKAEEHEQVIEQIKTKTIDEAEKAQIQAKLEALRESREKAKAQLKRHEKPEKDKTEPDKKESQ